MTQKIQNKFVPINFTYFITQKKLEELSNQYVLKKVFSRVLQLYYCLTGLEFGA